MDYSNCVFVCGICVCVCVGIQICAWFHLLVNAYALMDLY